MDEKISKFFLPLLDKLYNTEPAGEPFRKPVDPIKYGCIDYYLYVKHPIDLSTIRDKLVRHQYKDAWRFVADVHLMFSNAYLFNKKGTPVYEYTNKLRKIWTSELPPIMQRLNYCCGTLHKFGPQLLFCHGTTPERYCQIAIGAKYKCYQDSYSFCIPCFNRIDNDYVSIQALTCETTRMKLPTQPIKKSDFIDCTNDNWQYETFIQCTNCSKRVHQICDLYPANQDEIERCPQHAQIEEEQKLLCHVPTEFARFAELGSDLCVPSSQVSLDDELLAFARDIEDSNSNNWAPASPNMEDSKANLKESSNLHGITFSGSNSKSSVDIIAERLSISKSSNECHLDEKEAFTCDKFVCNHCYRKQRLGFNLKFRKYSARRLPHTRMSRYIETKVNGYMRENSPSAGEITIRVLTAYRDTVEVKQEMRDYIHDLRRRDQSHHPNLDEYPNEFEFTNRAIFAWQEIDGVDVCVFGMHVQEYGEDCPEPNRQVVYLSYLDSVHFFRPKQFRTAVYHEILLAYFTYVKKLGFRRVFIWVCPSRKGDDYIFYRHPTEQKMPTLKRLSDWYVHLLDKGVLNGIVERHQNIYEYSMSESWTSIFNLPYLSGDYWPGEFERLLRIMIESRKKYEESVGSASGIDHHSRISMSPEESKHSIPFTPNSTRSDDQPLDLSKTSSNTSPDSCYDDDQISEASFNARKKRRKSSTIMGYTKKRSRVSQSLCSQTSEVKQQGRFSLSYDGSSRFQGKSKSCLQKLGTQTSSHLTENMLSPEEEMIKNLERSLKRQKDGFIVVRLSECDCSPHFENQRRKEEVTSFCALMKGREPFLQLSRLKNYEFSTPRRAKFSSLAMVKHLGSTFKLDPICNDCFSFDSSKRHYACQDCEDYYLCTSCYENTQHEHTMSLIAPTTQPDIDEFLPPCSLASATNSISSASSTISNKSFNETSFELSMQAITALASPKEDSTSSSLPANRHSSKTSIGTSVGSMPLGCKRQRNRELSISDPRSEDEENSNYNPFASDPKLSLPNRSSPPPSHSANPSTRTVHVEMDQVMIENFVRHAELTYNVDFDEMKNDSKKLLTHYWACPMKDTCSRCKFVVLSCSFMSVLMRSTRMQMMINSNLDEGHLPDSGSCLTTSGINLTTNHPFS